MSEPIPQLRPKQVEQLSFYIANRKCLDLSDPGTGKTPPCCVMAYYVHAREQKATLWSQPKSLMKKNRREMLRFTEFEPHQVEVMKNDRANLTAKWTGPTIAATRKVATWELKDGGFTHEIRYNKNNPFTSFFWRDAKAQMYRKLGTGKDRTYEQGLADNQVVVEPKLGPDEKPIKTFHEEPELFKDLIADAVQRGVRVFICTFAFMSANWERMLEAAPDIDLLLVDELHMGYGGVSSEQTNSFYHVNKHVSRFIGMTGTLINGRWDTAFPALHVIEPRYYGSYHGFVYEHCAHMDDYGRITTWKNEAKLKAIMERHSIRRTFEEVYGKEPVVFFTESVEVGPEAREIYDEFHENAMLELDDGRIIEGSSAGVALIRARQILCHPETMVDRVPEWTEKDERVAVHLAESGNGLLFAALVPEQERLVRLCESLGLRVALINNTVGLAERDRIDQMAQRGELDVIVASGPTVAVGFNWEMFDLVVFVSLDYMDVNVVQGYRRASRGSRTTTLRVIFLKYLDTVEHKVFNLVRKKSIDANRVDENRPILSFND